MPEPPRSRARELLDALLQLVFPPRCQVCDRFCPTPLCAQCADAFERLLEPWCERCGEPFDPRAQGRPICADCGAECRPGLDRARSFGLHHGTLRDAVNALKFHGRIRLARPLGELLSLVLSANPEEGLLDPAQITTIVPVPLHPARRRWRGYNQAELLARALSATSGLPLRADWLSRVRDTPPQVGQSRTRRERNVRGAFAPPAPWPAPGARILLVDDVYTTGATMRECARVLRKAGAEAVYAATIVRAVPDWMPDAGDAPAT